MYVFASIGSSTGASSIVGPSNVLYVDVAGVDATGTRGNAARPFLTVQAATAQAQTGDQVRIGPGSFAIATSITQPAGITGVSWAGSGAPSISLAVSASTTLAGAAGVAVFDLGAALGLTSASISGMLITSTGGGRCIRADGSLYAANGFLGFGLFIHDVSLTDSGGAALDFKYARTVYGRHIRGNGTTSIVTSGTVSFDMCDMGTAGAMLCSYDGTDVLRTTSQLQVTVRGGSRYGAITLTGQGRFFADATVSATSITGNLMTVAGGFFPAVQFAGTVGTIDFQSTAAKMLPDTATALTFDFTGCVLSGASALFEVTAPASAQIVNMTGVTGNAAAQTIRANAGIALTARGNAFRAPTYVTAGTGTINPGQLNLAPVAVAAPTVFAFGFTVPVATYVVNPMSDTAASVPTAVTARSTTGFSVAVAAAGGGFITPSVTFS